MDNSPPIEFDKQDPGHSSITPLMWTVLSNTNKKYIISRENIDPTLPNHSFTEHAIKPIAKKKLRAFEPKVNASHGNCYGRGYIAFLGRSVSSPWTDNFRYNYEAIQRDRRTERNSGEHDTTA